MAVTRIAKPGDFSATFFLLNRSTPDILLYGITADGKVYRNSKRYDVGAMPQPGGPGTWIDTTLTIPDISSPNDL